MFDMKKPCSNCPFMKAGGIRLKAGRVREIAGYFTDSQGGTFPCHKTVDYDEDGYDDDGDTERPMMGKEQLCMGGVLFADKQGRANQSVRIAERIGSLDLRTVSGRELVFDSLAGMLRTAIDLKKKPKPKGKKPKSK